MNSLARAFGITRRAAFCGILGALSFTLLVATRSAEQGEIKRQPVASSVLASAGYDAGKRLLEIEFHAGTIYRYLEVPEEIYRRLLAADSKGHFFSAVIRNKFRSERVQARIAK